MHRASCEQAKMGLAENQRHGAAGGKTGHVDPASIHPVFARDVLDHTREKRSNTPAPIDEK